MQYIRKNLYKFAKRCVEGFLAYDVPERAIYSKDNHLKLLLTASLVNGFVEGVSRSLSGSPTGETVLSYIKTQEPCKLVSLFDELVEQNVEVLKKRGKLRYSVPIAIDWHDVMYYGNPDTPMVQGTQHKKGSNYAFKYLTVSVLVDGERLIIVVLPLITKKDVYNHTRSILHRVQELGVKIRYVTMDGGFYNTDIINCIEELKLKYILHMPRNGKTKKMKLWHNRTFIYTTNNHKRKKSKQISFNVTVAYDKNKKYTYLFATNTRYDADTILNLYNKRWGIETSYRMSNQFLIKTTSLQYTVRLFHYLFACLVYNTWVLYNEKKELPVTMLKLYLIGFITNQENTEKKPT